VDPDEALRQLRKMAESLGDIGDDAADFVGLFEALDNWLSSGGFLPASWDGREDRR